MRKQPSRGGFIHDHRHQSILQRIVTEDVGDLGADDRAKAIVEQCPGRMLARRAAAEVAAADEDLSAPGRRIVEYEVLPWAAGRVIAPIIEQVLAQSLARGSPQKARRDDLVGVDIGRGQNDRTGAYLLNRLRDEPQSPMSSRGSVTRPRKALAAAVSGLTSSVRAPGPWRPSKLRLLVLSEYWPLSTVSPFIPRHIEQPDSRHSAPASMKIRSRPSASASFLTC